MALTLKTLFGDTELQYGRKHPQNSPLIDIWETDREYLLWACNLLPKQSRLCDNPPPPLQRKLIEIALALTQEKKEKAESDFAAFQHWKALSQAGEGLSNLERPSPETCQQIISEATLLGGHSDLDGVYSLAAAIKLGGALGGASQKVPFSKIKLFHYFFRNIKEYSEALQTTPQDTTIVIDFPAHPEATLNLDHHSTCLSFWEPGAPLPVGVYDSKMPSCPRLLATHCGLSISEEILTACDMIDGALYTSVEQAHNLDDPFVCLEYALSVDVSQVILRKVVITLAKNDLDPNSVLKEPVWQTRIQFLKEQLLEQKNYWAKPTRFDFKHPQASICDARLAPYSASRFRYVVFENEKVLERPYVITYRGSPVTSKMNVGIGRNPFYVNSSFFEKNPLNIGSLCRSLGGGGGRVEVGSFSTTTGELKAVTEQALIAIDESVVKE